MFDDKLMTFPLDLKVLFFALGPLSWGRKLLFEENEVRLPNAKIISCFQGLPGPPGPPGESGKPGDQVSNRYLAKQNCRIADFCIDTELSF